LRLVRLPTAARAAASFVALSAAVITGRPSTARADDLPSVDVGFYLQPQIKVRQNSDVPDDEDGFAVRRFRLLVSSGRNVGCWRVDARSEIEAYPTFSPQDAYLVLAGPIPGGKLTFQLGQFKTPFSRQVLVSDSRLQFVDKAQVTSLAPERQVGVAATAKLPMSEVSFGVFNGDGKNVADAQDENYMYVGRVTLRPFGQDATLMETAFQGLQLEVSGSLAYNKRDRGDSDQTAKYYGIDGFAAYEGASLAAEYLEVRNTFSTGAPDKPFKGNGFYVQGGYLLPIPGWAWRRFELSARLEEVDRNDTVAIPQVGHPDQSLRYYTLGASYYHARHDLKVQLQASHIREIEDLTSNGVDAKFANDTVILQVTYRQ